MLRVLLVVIYIYHENTNLLFKNVIILRSLEVPELNIFVGNHF